MTSQAPQVPVAADLLNTTNSLSRRKLLQHGLSIGLATSAAGALLSACGGGSSSNGPVTLTVWDYYGDGDSLYSQRYTDFQKAYPAIKIQRQAIPFDNFDPKILQAAAAGTLPDVLLLGNNDLTTFADKGVLADLTSRAQTWGQLGEYYPGIRAEITWKNKTYAIPNGSNCLALYYNADLLQQAGVKPPTTWDELRSTAKTLTKNGVYGMVLSAAKSEEGTFQFLPYLWQSGADLNSLDSPAATAALQLLVDLIQDGSLSKEVINYAQNDAINQFIAGKAAMCENGPWQVPGIKQNAKFNWSVALLPAKQTSASILGGEVWAVAKSSPHVDAAWTFLEYTQERTPLVTYLAGGSLPTRSDIANDPAFTSDPITSIFAKQVAVARPRAYGPNYPQISAAIQQALQSALSGQQSASDAMKQAAATVKPLLP